MNVDHGSNEFLFLEKWEKNKSEIKEKLDIDTEFIPSVGLVSDIIVKIVVDHVDRMAIRKEEYKKTIVMSDCSDADTLYLCCQRMAELCQGLDYAPAGVWLGMFCEKVLEKYRDAQYWYNRAAYLGDGIGMYRVGLLYLDNKVPLPSGVSLTRYFTDAMDHGVPEAKEILDKISKQG